MRQLLPLSALACLTLVSCLGEDGLGPDGTPLSAVVHEPDPPVIAIAPSSPRTGDDLSVTIFQDAIDPDGDEVSITWMWARDGAQVEGADSQTIASDQTQAGQEWSVLAIPSDGTFSGEPARASVIIGNTAPEGSASLSHETAGSDQDVEVSATGTDVDGDLVDFDYLWRVDDQPVLDLGSILPAQRTHKGERWTVRVTPHDGLDSGTASDLTVDIINSAPSISAAVIEPLAPLADAQLSCQGVDWSDADDDAEGYQGRWLVGGTEVATGLTLDSSYFVRGDSVVCELTPDDGEEAGAAVASTAVIIGNALPAIDSVSLSSITPVRADTLSATISAADADGDVISYAYQWLVNGAQAGSGETMDLAGLIPGDQVQLQLTPSDAIDAGEAVLSDLAVVRNQSPGVDQFILTPANPYTGDDVEIVYSVSDADGDTVSSSVQWMINGVVVSNQGAHLSNTLISAGDLITAQLVPNDGYDSGTPAIDSVTVLNTVPTLASASITPTNPTVEDTLACVPFGWFDPDNGVESYVFNWTINASPVSGTATGELPLSAYSAGDVAQCTVAPSDGQDQGGSVASASVTVLNAPPTLSNFALDNLAPYRADVITLSYSAADADGDAFTEQLDWQVNGSSVANSGLTFDLAASLPGDEVQAVLTVSDSSQTISYSSDIAIVQNFVPVIDSASLSALNPVTDTVLDLVFQSSDGDGDAVTASSQWMVNGNTLAWTGFSLDGADYFEAGDLIEATLNLSDGVGGTATQLLSATVQNSPPSVVSAQVSPDPAMASDDLLCDGVGWSDLDNDIENYQVQWLIGGQVVSTAQSITSPLISQGQSVECTLVPDDGLLTGAQVQSAAVVITNSLPEVGSLVLSDIEPNPGDVITSTVSGVVDVDGDSVTLTYAWTVNGAPVSSDVQLDTTGLQGGDDIVLTVVPNDGNGNGNGNGIPAVATAQMFNARPTVDTLVLLPSDPTTNSVLQASATASDPDSSALTLSYEWLVGGVLLSETGPSLSGSSFFDKDDVVEVRVTANDGHNNGNPVSETVTVLNSPPTAPSVSITPAQPRGGEDDLVCTLQSLADDADGDSIGYSFAWTVDSAPYSNAGATTYPGDTVPGSATTQGEQWQCTVSTFDGEEAGDSDSDTALTTGCAPELQQLAYFKMDSGNYCGSGNYHYYPWDWNDDGLTDLVVNDGYYYGRRTYILQNTSGGVALGWSSPDNYAGASGSTGSSSSFNNRGYREIDHTTEDWDQDGQEELLIVGNYFAAHAWENGLFLKTGNFSNSGYKLSVTTIDWDGIPPREVITGTHSQGLHLHSYDGNTLNEEFRSHSSSYGFGAVSVGDFDNDGDEEVLVGNASSSFNGSYLSLMEVVGRTSFDTVWTNSDSINQVLDIQSGDVDGDGWLDFLAVGTFGAWLYLNDQAGDFILTWISPESTTMGSASLADVNGDGALDIIIPSEIQRFNIYLNQGGSFVPLAHSNAGQGRAVAVMDFDNDGRNDVVYTQFEHSGVTSTGRNTCHTYVASLSCVE